MKQTVEKVVVPNWREVKKRWSVRLGVIGTLITGFAVAVPDVALQVWVAMPMDLKAALPPDFVKWFGLGLLIAGQAAAFIRQRKKPQ